MNFEVLGIVKVRNTENIEDCIKTLEKYCTEIIIIGEDDEYSSYGKLDLIPFDLINPDWIISVFSDEIISPRFNYMARTLMANEFINSWDAHILHFWNMYEYRADKLWDSFDVSFLWRFMPEIDYKWKGEEIVPYNQPGPEKHSSVFLFNRRFDDKLKRAQEFKEFFKDEPEYNAITQLHYHSLVNTDGMILERWTDG